MNDLKNKYNCSVLTIVYYFFLIALCLPLMVLYKNSESLVGSDKVTSVILNTVSCGLVFFAIIIILFLITNFFFKNKNKSFVIVLSTILISIHNNVTLDLFIGYFDIDTSYKLNVLLFFSVCILNFYFTSKSTVASNFIRILSFVYTNIYFIYPVFSIIAIFALNPTQNALAKKQFNYKPIEASNKELPDIYYVLTDMYGSYDTLEKLFNYKNDEFYNLLEESGFLVKKNSCSNYLQTDLTAATLMNMNYIQDVFIDEITKINATTLQELHQKNPVNDILIKNNYKIYQSSPFPLSISKHRMSESKEVQGLLTTSLGSVYKQSLASTYLSSINYIIFGPYHNLSSYQTYANGIKTSLKNMDYAAKDIVDQPKFLFAHILSPHNPFVFNGDGTLRKPNELFDMDCCFEKEKEYYFNGEKILSRIDKGAYIEELKYINKRLIEFIQNVRANAKRPYIIVIQGDHGTASSMVWNNPSDEGIRERLSILDAVYVSDNNYNGFSYSTSHVNIFRNILNKYFGYNIPLLEHKSYFSPYGIHNAKFNDVTNLCRE